MPKQGWSVAVVRWIRQVRGGGTQMGIELIAPHAQACGLQLVRKAEQNSQYLRALLLPEISAQFETLKASAEGTLEATITSAQELTQAQIDDLVAGLKAKFNRAVNVQVTVDPELIGGAVIAVGDQVIDGSVKGRLQRMAFSLQG
jgi:hypothetical protein